ncbi:anaerobic ribonucleoside-triphosphate reductase activating protein [Anaerofilum sp. BX8]|uniref:Anaerobic ribonucleoside-triphosphate reductase activating protein n=1 Tax=Anaerofilum hominis TaxID=2763016 RepID=A0A923L216_9FIRM|nr:anaerobic ribonucleoside-triphosphate reductase activating protein [Anaerofilum hominis]MBC5582415.1 anaerobic ribonucleoside-triphosphate reductase activating protein [Anaerofilum hominis]
MKIEGLQKLTLLDYPGRLACTVFLGGCNLRCPFCHNADLVLPGRPSADIGRGELIDFLKKRRGVLQGVCVTGGEPLVSDGVEELLREIKDLGYAVKLDTNGTFPDRLQALAAQGLVDYVAMDVKNAPESYGPTVGLPGFDPAPVLRSAAFLLSGAVEYEFRTTVVDELHTEADFESIGRWLAGAKRYFLQGFVDSGNLVGQGLHAAPKERMERFRQILLPLIPAAEIRGV